MVLLPLYTNLTLYIALMSGGVPVLEKYMKQWTKTSFGRNNLRNLCSVLMKFENVELSSRACSPLQKSFIVVQWFSEKSKGRKNMNL